MRRLFFDQYEFDTPNSEESLELVISSPRQHPDLGAFLKECGASAQDGPPPAPGWPRWHTVTEHLRRLAGVELPHPSRFRAAVLMHDDWNDLELAIAFGPLIIWYHWSTTA
jgi:hypothetical protein